MEKLECSDIICKIALFGHRDFSEHISLEKILPRVFENILAKYELLEIFIGRNGEFDVFTASVIKRFQKKAGQERCEITLVLPYTVSNIEDYQRYYDDIIIPIKSYPKAAIAKRNKWMVENSDLVLVFVKKTHGGAYEAMRYAEKLGKRVINLAELDCENNL